MSRRARWWLIGSAVLTLLLVAAALAAWQLAARYGPTLTRDRVASALSAALERPVHVERVILEPWLGRVGLAGVRVAAGPSWDDGTMLQAGRALATLGISSLWRRELVISRILVEDLDLVLEGDGGGDGPPVFPIAIPERIDVGPVTAALGALEVRRARVRYDDESVSVQVEGLGGRARPRDGGIDVTAQARAVRVSTAGVAETLDDVEATGHLGGDRLALDPLELGWLGERLRARGQLTGLGGATQVDVAISGRVALGPLAERADSPWDVAGLATVEARVRGPVERPAVEGRLAVPELVAGPVSARRVSARADWRDDRLDLTDVAAETLGGKVTGSLALEPAALARTRATFRADGVELAELEALLAPVLDTPPGLRGPITAEGEVRGDPTQPARLRASVRLEAPHVEAPGDLGRLGPAAVSGRVQLADGTIEVPEARGRWAAATVEAAGSIETRGHLALKGSASGDLARLAGAWDVAGVAGDVALDVEVAGPWDAPALRGVASAPSVMAHGTRLQAVHVPFSATARSLRVDGATAALGQTAVRLTGTARWTAPGPIDPARWQEALRVEADVAAAAARAADLQPWLPAEWPVAGDFSLAARVQGTAASWKGTGRLQSPRLDVRGTALEQVHAEFALTPSGLDVSPLRLRALGAPLAGQVAWRWDGTGTAHVDVGPVRLATVPGVPEGAALGGSGRARVNARIASGGVVDADASVALQDVSAGGVALGDGSARATVRDGQLAADLAFPEARVSATASGRLEQGQTLTVRARADDVDAGTLAARAAPANGAAYGRVEGRLSAVAELAVPYADPAAADGTLRVEPLQLTWAGEQWTARGPVLVRRRAAVTALERLELESRFGTFTASGTMGDDGSLALDARGRLPLSVLAAFRPEVRSAAGQLDASVKLGGTVDRPEIVGEGEISGGQLTLADYPDTLRDVRARFTTSPRAVRLVEATAALGGGELRASGEMALDDARPGAYRFTVTARQVALTPVADLNTAWDADLELVGLAERAQLRGEARLLRGLYTRDISILRTLLEGGPAREGTAGAGAGLHLDLRVALQDNLVVRTTITRFRAGGTLTVAGTTSAPVVFGTVETREGQIVFRRQTFTLTSASARFIDPRRIDPVLDVRGTAQIRGYDVTLHVSGRSEDLEIRFSSSPPLPEEDVLSLVAFGATREQIGRSGPGVVVGEIAGLLVQDLFGVQSSRAGVDVFELDTDPEIGTRTLRVGKQLTPRTLVVYSQDLDNADARRLRLEYQVFGPLRVAGEQDFRGGFGGEVLLRMRFR